MDEVTLTASELATVAGASAAAIVVTQFAKALLNTSAAVTRSISLVTGVVIVVIGTVLTDGTGFIDWLLALIVGMQAGLAASAGYDTVRSGVTYAVTKSEGE